MTHCVDPSKIEQIVGVDRHRADHYGRAVSADKRVYILHPHDCVDTHSDLRECRFSVALDRGIDPGEWSGMEDRPVRLAVCDGRLTPAEADVLRRLADRLAAALDLVLHDAHPVYPSTAKWHGGIGGQAITPHCSIINGGPPGDDWAQFDLPSKPLRDYIDHQQARFDLHGTKDDLKREWLAALDPDKESK